VENIYLGLKHWILLHMCYVCCNCQGLNVIAYASYCRRDQRGRPIAGYINICPQMLTDSNYDEGKVYWVW